MKASETRRLVLISCRKAETELEVVGWVGAARKPEYQINLRHGTGVTQGVRLGGRHEVSAGRINSKLADCLHTNAGQLKES